MVVNCIHWLPRNQEGRISGQNFLTESLYQQDTWQFWVLYCKALMIHMSSVTLPSLLLLFPQHITLLQSIGPWVESKPLSLWASSWISKRRNSPHCTTHLTSPLHPLPRGIFWKEKSWGKVFPNTTPSTQVLRNITLNLERTLNTYMLRREGNEPGDRSHSFLLDFREHFKARNQHGVHVGYSAT